MLLIYKFVKHLLVYENMDKTLKLFSVGDYWRYRNYVQDSIFKVIHIKRDKGVFFEIFIMEKNGLQTTEFIKLYFSYNDLDLFIESSYDNKIFRIATKDESDNFEVMKQSNKFNL